MTGRAQEKEKEGRGKNEEEKEQRQFLRPHSTQIFGATHVYLL